MIWGIFPCESQTLPPSTHYLHTLVQGLFWKFSERQMGQLNLKKSYILTFNLKKSYIQLEKILHLTWKNLTFNLKNLTFYLKILHFNDKNWHFNLEKSYTKLSRGRLPASKQGQNKPWFPQRPRILGQVVFGGQPFCIGYIGTEDCSDNVHFWEWPTP